MTRKLSIETERRFARITSFRGLPCHRPGREAMMGTGAAMADQDQLDRMERKINRIGRFVLLGIVLIGVVIANNIRLLPDGWVQGYGLQAGAAFIALVILAMLAARGPFRD
jgi:multisubunit Na+/H+ antiporter MnhB subunit